MTTNTNGQNEPKKIYEETAPEGVDVSKLSLDSVDNIAGAGATKCPYCGSNDIFYVWGPWGAIQRCGSCHQFLPR